MPLITVTVNRFTGEFRLSVLENWYDFGHSKMDILKFFCAKFFLPIRHLAFCTLYIYIYIYMCVCVCVCVCVYVCVYETYRGVYSVTLQSGPIKCTHSLLINIFGINLNKISISG